MIPPEEKAKELLDKFYQATPPATTWNPVELNKKVARESALMCIDEITEVLKPLESYWHNDVINPVGYWQQVKEKIETS